MYMKCNAYLSVGLLVLSILLLMQFPFVSLAADNCSNKKISLAYVESARPNIPDPFIFSHLIYAFCDFNNTNDGVELTNPDKLRKMCLLKDINPDLKVILGIGGFKKEGFSEMSADKRKRSNFVKQCKQIIDGYGLDGIDLDWEFPGTTAGGHSASPDDEKNYVKLVKDLRKTLGKNKTISFYSNNSGNWIDFPGMLKYVDYVHVSGYNLDVPKPNKKIKHQSPLYSSPATGDWCIDKSIKRHISLGVPPDKILMGIPFFGRGTDPYPNYVEAKGIPRHTEEQEEKWDDSAKAPYYVDKDGDLALGFDNEESISIKCDYIKSHQLAGSFIWTYDSDFDDHRLGRQLNSKLLRDNE